MTEESKPIKSISPVDQSLKISHTIPVFINPKFKCPTCLYTTFIDKSQPHSFYCPECYAEFIAKNVPKLIEIKDD